MEHPCSKLAGRLRRICEGTDLRCTGDCRRQQIAQLLDLKLIERDPDAVAEVPGPPAPKPPQPVANRAIPLYIDRSAPCVHLGEVLRVEPCKLCGQSGKTEAVHSCPIRGECTRKAAGLTVTDGKRLMTVCLNCTSHEPAETP